MVVLDANILIYAYFPDTIQHRAMATWLEEQFDGPDIIGLSWQTLCAFVRVGSNGRVWPRPPETKILLDLIDGWLRQPNVIVVQPGSRYPAILRNLVLQSGATGNLVSDAALAAIAIEHAATLASTDRDFGKFSGLRWVNPLD